ncbi:long-chain-fatty-acid--CoA ligase [Nitratireductor sp. GCM10026969]|uniref:long-chain-fatty-acid--CoA ligase n=1 Tax=Nitratireductor sp. GCM10026969 TaxID=3252645 RepID=UPI003617BC3F
MARSNDTGEKAGTRARRTTARKSQATADKQPAKTETPSAKKTGTAAKKTAATTSSRNTAKSRSRVSSATKTNVKSTAKSDTGDGNAKTSARRSASAKSPTAKSPAAKATGTKAAAPARPKKAAPAARRRVPAKKPWLKSYPEDIPAEIGTFAHSSLGDLMVESSRHFADRPAFTSMGKTLTFAGVEEASRHFAAYLQSLGLKKGARVAIMMPNVLQYPVALMAALRAGYVVVNVNPLYTPRELEHQLVDSGAEVIVILENFARTLQKTIGQTPVKHVVVASMGDMLGLKGRVVNFVVRRIKKMVPAWELPGHVPFKSAMREGAARRFQPVEVGLDDLAFLQYTGGTTGVSKGAMLLHRNVLANAMQNEIWLETAYTERPRPERPVFICVLPLYHVYALTVNALTGMKLGAENVLIVNPRDIPALVKELGKHDFNAFIGLNTLFNALLNNEDFRKLSFKNLDLTLGGGMAVQRSVAERWQALTNCVIAEGYGLSETSPVATVNRLDMREFTGTIGLPLPSTDIAIRDEDGKDVKQGTVGEICIRGPQVMPGYWNKPGDTKKAITKDGFFKSGDMGVMDKNGFIKIVDRKKDMILVSGFNVYPNEIEDVVVQHAGVLEAAAVGVPDEHSGEVPKLFVVKKDAALTEKDVLDFCRKELTGYKRPKYVEFRDELPKSNVGKILRRELR